MAKLLDQYGRPVNTMVLKQEIAGPTVTGLRDTRSGHPWQGLTPARLAGLLREAEDGDALRYLELAEEMEEKDLHYAAVLSTRKRQVSQLDITVEAADDSAEAARHAETVETWLDRETLEEEIFDLLDGIGKGYSVLEILWETSAGGWSPRELAWRDPRWFRFAEDARTLLLIDAGGAGVPLDPYKFVVHAHKAKSGIPIRGGLARAAAWALLFKNFDIKGWVSFAEVFGQPLRLGRYGPGASVEDKDALLRALSGIARDAAAMIPESMMIEFVESKVSANIDLFERLANYMDQQVSKLVLGQTATTDAISGGHAVSQEHNEVRGDIERSDAKQLAATLSAQVVRPLIDLNHGPQAAYPRLRIGRAEEVDVPAIVDGVSKLVPLGFKVSQKYLRDLMGVPDPEDDDELLEKAAPAMPAPGTPGVPASPGSPAPTDEDPEAEQEDPENQAGRRNRARPEPAASQARAGSAPAASDPIERLIARLADDGQLAEALDPMLGPLAETVAGAEDFADLSARIGGLVEKMGTDKMGELLARAMFASRLSGETGAE